MIVTQVGSVLISHFIHGHGQVSVNFLKSPDRMSASAEPLTRPDHKQWFLSRVPIGCSSCGRTRGWPREHAIMSSPRAVHAGVKIVVASGVRFVGTAAVEDPGSDGSSIAAAVASAITDLTDIDAVTYVPSTARRPRSTTVLPANTCDPRHTRARAHTHSAHAHSTRAQRRLTYTFTHHTHKHTPTTRNALSQNTQHTVTTSLELSHSSNQPPAQIPSSVTDASSNGDGAPTPSRPPTSTPHITLPAICGKTRLNTRDEAVM
jgi:hypothetical protein